jgi:hypothetical protein
MKRILLNWFSTQVRLARHDGYKKGKKEAVQTAQIEKRKLKKRFAQIQEKNIKEIKKYFHQIIIEKNKEIRKLKNKIDKNRNAYKDLRRRESEIDAIVQDMNNVSENMTIQIHESIQPLLRLLGKTERIKRESNKKDEKMNNVFEMIK